MKRDGGRAGGSGEKGICFGMYNSFNGINGVIKSLLRGIYQADCEPRFFQETMVTDKIYMRTLA